MNTKQKLVAERYLKVAAIAEDGTGVVDLSGSQISPRGVCAVCSQADITQLHSHSHSEVLPSFQTLLLTIELGFTSGEVLKLETSAKVQRVRRVSQEEFEVYLEFSGMIQDGYRHIARYIVDSAMSSTE